jgi:antitoxin component YwqK of YwqJK toxin-antitoxin module
MVRKYKDGKKEGLGTGWWDNGQKKFEGKYKDGKKDGHWTAWYENGQKESERNYVDGKLVR